MKTNQSDAIARWQLEQGDPAPMRKRIAAQEKTAAVSAYLENCELLDQFEEEFDDD
jgi:hypothetical protein